MAKKPRRQNPVNPFDVRPKKKRATPKPLCGTCAKPFDGVEAAKAAREGRPFIHDCGRVLVRGRGNAEVPTHDHVYHPDDDVNTNSHGNI